MCEKGSGRITTCKPILYIAAQPNTEISAEPASLCSDKEDCVYKETAEALCFSGFSLLVAVRTPPSTFISIHFGNGSHVLGIQCEVKYLIVFYNPVLLN